MRTFAVLAIAASMLPAAAFAYTQDDADACTPDAFRLCQMAMPDAGRVTQCLEANKPNSAQPVPACSAGRSARQNGGARKPTASTGRGTE